MHFIHKILYSHNVWLFLRKLLIKYPFLYKIFLRKKNIRDFDKKLVSAENKDFGLLEGKFYEDLKKFTDKFKTIKNKNVFLCMDMPWSWEPAYLFRYLKHIFWYLLSKNCRIYIITNNPYKYVIRLYKKYFDIEYLYYDTKISEDIYDFVKMKEWIIIDNVWYPDTSDIFFKYPDDWWVYGTLNRVEQFISQQLWEIKLNVLNDYEFMDCDLDMHKLDKIMEFSEWEKLVLCNFESKSGNMVNEYKIKMEDIMEKLLNIKNSNIKILINSVYDWYAFKWTKNLMVDKLNFQEIIWLAEYNKLWKFISFRNWINDILFNFYPSIGQVVYYPDEYTWNVSKKDYARYKWNSIDLKCDWIHRWGLPKRENLKQYIKNEFWETIDVAFDDK